MVQNIFRHVKAVNLNSVQNQHTMTWNALNCEFQFQILKSSAINTIKQFLLDLDIYVNIWHEIIKSRFYHSKSESESDSIFKRIIYNKQWAQFFRWKTKNRDLFKIMTNFMNLFNITDQIKYFSVYHNQKSFRNLKSDLNHIFNLKIIIEFLFKIRLQITFEKKSDFRKNRNKNQNKSKKFYKSKAHAYLTNENEKRDVDYYDFNDDFEKKNWKSIMKRNLHSKRWIKKIFSWN